MTALAHPLPAGAVNAKLIDFIAATAVAIGVLLSGFVLREPAPYEIYMAGLIGVWALFGLRISRRVAPLLALLIVFNIGGMISMLQMKTIGDTPLYIAVSLFLAFTSVFFAAVIERRPDLFKVIFTAWIVAATTTAFLGIAGYFGIVPGAENFVRYSRAAGAFGGSHRFLLVRLCLLDRLLVLHARSGLPRIARCELARALHAHLARELLRNQIIVVISSSRSCDSR